MKCGISYHGNKFCDGRIHAHTHTQTDGWMVIIPIVPHRGRWGTKNAIVVDAKCQGK